MPYNDAFRDKSWHLLVKASGHDHWVKRLFHSSMEDAELEGLLCMPRNHGAARSDVSFPCQLTCEHVLLLIRNQALTPKDILFEIRIEGEKQTWQLTHNAQPVTRPIEETIPPAPRGTWRKPFSSNPEFLPFMAVAVSSGDGKERVSITALAVTETKEFSSIMARGCITDDDRPWKAKVFVDYE